MSERPLRIPDLDRAWLKGFLAAHPEQRERFRELYERDREVRDLAEVVIGDIYGHYTTGSPSRRGLRVSLRAYVTLLEEEDARIRRAGREPDLGSHLDELRLGLEMRLHREEDPGGRGRYLLAVIDELREQLDDTHAALTAADRLAVYAAATAWARAQALREAAQLVRGGSTPEELDRLAAEAEPPWLTLDEFAELDRALRDESEEQP